MSALATVYRVQDGQGRGPYRPGLSMQWSDTTDPTIPEEHQLMVSRTAEVLAAMGRLNQERRHRGFGFLSLRDLWAWFSASERIKLRQLGFRIVKIESVRIEMQSPAEVMFSTARPLAELAVPLPLLN